MKLQNVRLWLILPTLAVSAGCGNIPHTITLASGTHINVQQEGSQTFKDDDGVTNCSFGVLYQTQLSLDDKPALRDEMAQVFLFYKPRIEQERCIRAYLAPGKGSGFAPFYLDRRPSGKWLME